MIEPTVGRIVWVRHPSHEQPLAAIVCKVHDNQTINICMYTELGVPTPIIAIHLKQEDDETPDGAYAEWMPFQRGAAAAYDVAKRGAQDGGPEFKGFDPR